MRYPTCGDYWIDKRDVLQFRVAEMSDWRFEFLVVLHELIEYALITWLEIPIALIDKFDIMFEKERLMGFHSAEDEPGNDPRAPYRKQHRWATRIERFVSLLLWVNWKQYEQEIVELS